MLKVTIDANVFVSALLTPGNSEVIASHLKRASFELFYPEQLIQDLRTIPSKRKLKGRITQQQIDVVIRSIEELGTLVYTADIPSICRDPDDDAYLACTAAIECDYLVSGDLDLLELKTHGCTKIVNPAQFVHVLEQS